MTIMQKSSLTSIYDRWARPSYEVRVRGTIPENPTQTYLCGSAGITDDIPFDKALILHLRNDIFGETITFGTKDASGQHTKGQLGPGEAVSIQINNISGVFASCQNESIVACVLTHE